MIRYHYVAEQYLSTSQGPRLFAIVDGIAAVAENQPLSTSADLKLLKRHVIDEHGMDAHPDNLIIARLTPLP